MLRPENRPVILFIALIYKGKLNGDDSEYTSDDLVTEKEARRMARCRPQTVSFPRAFQ